jgi:hypothetical protein
VLLDSWWGEDCLLLLKVQQQLYMSPCGWCHWAGRCKWQPQSMSCTQDQGLQAQPYCCIHQLVVMPYLSFQVAAFALYVVVAQLLHCAPEWAAPACAASLRAVRVCDGVDRWWESQALWICTHLLRSLLKPTAGTNAHAGATCCCSSSVGG